MMDFFCSSCARSFFLPGLPEWTLALTREVTCPNCGVQLLVPAIKPQSVDLTKLRSLIDAHENDPMAHHWILSPQAFTRSALSFIQDLYGGLRAFAFAWRIKP